MKKKILNSVLFLSLVGGLFSGLGATQLNQVEALSAATTLCGAMNASVHGSSDTVPTCASGGSTVVFTFEYDYNVTGFSSGADGY